MTIFPAVDIREGKAVRLRQGRKDEFDIFAADPVEMALEWERKGARWLHVVDLDGAFAGNAVNLPLVAEITEKLRIPLQIGGGIRTVQDAENYLNAGVNRLIIGTLALEEPNVFAELCKKFPGKIGVSLDAVKGKLKSRGWVRDTGRTIKDIVPELEAKGAAFIIYTDIERDGMRTGVNLSALEELLQMTSCSVLVAGGVNDMEDVKKLAQIRADNLEGFISGRALYEKSLDLPEVLAFLDSVKS